MPFSISRHLCVRENDWFQTRSLETWSFYYIFTEKKSSKPKFLVLQELNNWIPPVFCSCFLFFQDILTNNTIKLFSPSFVSCTCLSLSLSIVIRYLSSERKCGEETTLKDAQTVVFGVVFLYSRFSLQNLIRSIVWIFFYWRERKLVSKLVQIFRRQTQFTSEQLPFQQLQLQLKLHRLEQHQLKQRLQQLHQL